MCVCMCLCVYVCVCVYIMLLTCLLVKFARIGSGFSAVGALPPMKCLLHMYVHVFTLPVVMFSR